MEWRWQWFAAGIGGLLGLGLVRGLLKILTPVAMTGVAAYGLTTLFMRRRETQTKMPAVAPPRQPATTR